MSIGDSCFAIFRSMAGAQETGRAGAKVYSRAGGKTTGEAGAGTKVPFEAKGAIGARAQA